MSIIDIAKEAKANKVTVSQAISLYLKKPKENTILQSVINLPIPSRKPTLTRLILDTETGIYYYNAMELSKAVHKPHKTLCNYLSGNRKQKGDRFKVV
jgi:hypothetical protein